MTANLDLFGGVQCSRGWGRRCPLATSKSCSCACGGRNHGTKEGGAPVRATKTKKPVKPVDISVFIVENDALEKALVREHFGKGITFVQLIKKKDRRKLVAAIEQLDI